MIGARKKFIQQFEVSPYVTLSSNDKMTYLATAAKFLNKIISQIKNGKLNSKCSKNKNRVTRTLAALEIFERDFYSTYQIFNNVVICMYLKELSNLVDTNYYDSLDSKIQQQISSILWIALNYNWITQVMRKVFYFYNDLLEFQKNESKNVLSAEENKYFNKVLYCIAEQIKTFEPWLLKYCKLLSKNLSLIFPLLENIEFNRLICQKRLYHQYVEIICMISESYVPNYTSQYVKQKIGILKSCLTREISEEAKEQFNQKLKLLENFNESVGIQSKEKKYNKDHSLQIKFNEDIEIIDSIYALSSENSYDRLDENSNLTISQQYFYPNVDLHPTNNYEPELEQLHEGYWDKEQDLIVTQHDKTTGKLHEISITPSSIGKIKNGRLIVKI